MVAASNAALVTTMQEYTATVAPLVTPMASSKRTYSAGIANAKAAPVEAKVMTTGQLAR